MDTGNILCARVAEYFNCRLMPHGGPVLFPIVLVTLGLCASLADDGCDYARLRGAAVEMLTGSSVVPFIDCGMAAYRIPGFYPDENRWRVVYTDECQPYQYMHLLSDTSWIAAEWLRFLGLVGGGTTTMFLWTSTCLTLRPNYWQAAGIGAALGCLFQISSFVWFYTKLCHTSTTNFVDFESGREVEMSSSQPNATSSCTLFFGSKCAITSCVLYAVASAIILLREYPRPVPKLIAHDESVAMMAAPDQNQQPSQRRTSRSKIKGGKEKSSRSMALTASLSTAQSSQGSAQWISGAPDEETAGTGGRDNIRRSLRSSARSSNGFDSSGKGPSRPSSIRPNELAGSTFSAVSFC